MNESTIWRTTRLSVKIHSPNFILSGIRMPKPSQKKNWQQPGVVFQPETHEGMQRGINQLVQAIRPTLGPLPRFVANQPVIETRPPELLDDGGTIARRTIMLPRRNEDVGAMYIRQVLWKLRETAGDGTATAAVIFQKVYNEGIRYITAGGNAMLLRRYLEEGVRLVLAQLDQQVTFIHGKKQLAHLAETICYDAELARMLGEIFDIVSEFGRVEIRSGSSREIEREYIEGMYWDSKLFSREMSNVPNAYKAQAENAFILISDLSIEEPRDLLPILEAALQAKASPLFLVLATITDKAMSILTNQANREKLPVFVVKVPGISTTAQMASMQDLSILTGGRALIKASGDTFNHLKAEDFGRARRLWADSTYLGIVGGKGNPRQLREHLAHLRAGLPNVNEPNDRKTLIERISKLLSGSAVLWVGAATPTALEFRKELATRTTEAMRGAMREGVLAGGGAAYLSCIPLMRERRSAAVDSDERAAYNILLQALAEPARVILENAGFLPDEIMPEIRAAGLGFGFDVSTQKVTDMTAAGIIDSAAVLKNALISAVQGASLAMTVDVVIHRKNPPDASSTT
jgi:chaperonin GroEL